MWHRDNIDVFIEHVRGIDKDIGLATDSADDPQSARDLWRRILRRSESVDHDPGVDGLSLSNVTRYIDFFDHDFGIVVQPDRNNIDPDPRLCQPLGSRLCGPECLNAIGEYHDSLGRILQETSGCKLQGTFEIRGIGFSKIAFRLAQRWKIFV